MRKTKTTALLALLVLVCLVATLAFAACKDKGGLTLDKTEVTITENGLATVKVTENTSDEDVTWTVDNEDVVKIASSNKTTCSLRGQKKGTATLTATAGKATATVSVTVTELETITVTLDGQNVTEASVDKGSKIALVATTSKGSSVSWQSSNELIATVDNGVVTGVNKGQAVITAQVNASVKAEVTVTVTGEGAVLTQLGRQEESWALANTDQWVYFTESWVTVSEAYGIGNDLISITFANNKTDDPYMYFWATQLFYKNPALSSGTTYKLSFTATSPSTGRVTLNGNVITLEQGTHEYTTWYTESAKASFNLQLGVNGLGTEIYEGTLELKNVTWVADSSRETLVAPSFNYDSATNVITFTDTVNAKGSVKAYTLVFYDNNNAVKGSTVVVSGEAVNLGTIPNGTWTARLVVEGANEHYINSAPSENSVTIKVENEKTQLMNGGEHDSYIHPGIWYEWHDQGWNQSTVTVSDAYMTAEGAIHFSFSIAGSNMHNQAAHLYYHDSSKTPGTYMITMNVYASVACTITIGDQADGAIPVALNQGNNKVSVAFVHPAQNPDWQGQSKGSLIRIYFNNSGEFVLSDVNVVATQQVKLQAPTFSLNADKKITITDPNAVGVGSYELGYFQGDTLKKSIKITNNATVDPNVVIAGTYTLRLRALSGGGAYTTSDWSSSTATVTSTATAQVENVEFGENGVDVKTGALRSALATPDKMYYWNNQGWINNNYVTVSKAEVSDGVYTFTYSGAVPAVYQGFQLFYKNSANLVGKRYTVTFKLNASVGGTITVNDQKVTLVQGDNTVTVTYVEPEPQEYAGASLAIQFGSNADGTVIAGGTFILSGLTFTAA